jgi:hypothetical protein
MLHAYENPIRVFDMDEGFTMLVGGSRVGARCSKSALCRQQTAS